MMEWKEFIQVVIILCLAGYGIGWFIKKANE